MSTPHEEAPPLLLSPEAAARLLSIPRSRLYDLLADGTIRSVKLGRLRRIPRAALEDFVRQLEQGAA